MQTSQKLKKEVIVLSIDKLESIDINKLSIEVLTEDRIGEAIDNIFNENINDTNDDEINLKIRTSIRTGISSKFNTAILVAESHILELDTKRYIEVNLDLFFSLKNTNGEREELFKVIKKEATPVTSLEIINLVRNLSSQDSNLEPINIPYDFLIKDKEESQ